MSLAAKLLDVDLSVSEKVFNMHCPIHHSFAALMLVVCTGWSAACSQDPIDPQLVKFGVTDRFFRAVETENIDRLLSIFHPALREKSMRRCWKPGCGELTRKWAATRN